MIFTSQVSLLKGILFFGFSIRWEMDPERITEAPAEELDEPSHEAAEGPRGVQMARRFMKFITANMMYY